MSAMTHFVCLVTCLSSLPWIVSAANIAQDCARPDHTALNGADSSQESLDSEIVLLQTYLTVHKVNKVGGYAHVKSSRPWNTSRPYLEHHRAGKKTINKAMWATGAKFNAAGDLGIFVTALASNIFSFLFMVVIFAVCSRLYPCMYSNNVTIGMAPFEVPPGIFGWIKASLATMDDRDKLIDRIGLDHVMLIEFCQLCMKICVVLGIPLLLFLAPMHAFFGGHITAKSHDRLSTFSFGNVQNGSWLYWVHAFTVWLVVYIVQYMIYGAQSMFVPMRYKWLSTMPEPRSTTLLVTQIPSDYQSDIKLKEYFEDLFPRPGIKSAYVAKQTAKLVSMVSEKQKNIRYLEREKENKDKKAPGHLVHGKDPIEYYESEVQKLDGLISEERNRISEGSLKAGDEVNSNAGFVTFKSRIDAQMAARFDFSPDGAQDQWVVYPAPQPSQVIWADLVQSSHTKRYAYETLGYLLTAGLYMAYLPIVIGISQICMKIDLGPFDTLWRGFAPTIGLHLMVSFLPTFLVLIFRCCFTLYDDLQAQWILQNWYFVFQVVFIVLVTAISGSIFQFMELCVENPLKIPAYLGETMPFATHFYMNYLMMQWVTHGMNLTRYIYIGKFLIFRKMVHYDEEAARELSEPEDQDYYGMGSRSARFTIMMCLGIIYSTLCPPMIILCFINFAIARVVYGYLMTFAETKKGDTGGDFWVSKLQHLYVGLAIYVAVMSGVLYGRSDSKYPSMIVFCSLFYVIAHRVSFSQNFQWKYLPYPMLKSASQPEVMQENEKLLQRRRSFSNVALEDYIQEELKAKK